MIGAELETPRAPSGPGFAEAVTFAFGDPGAGVHGSARLGVAGGAGTVLALVFADGAPVAAAAHGGLPVPDGWSWDSLEAGAPGPDGVALAVETLGALASWRVRFAGAAGAGFDLVFDAVSAPFGDSSHDGPLAVAGGLAGYGQLCRVTGTVAAGGGAPREIACLGQRGHEWGVADWGRVLSARSVTAWLGDRHAVAFQSLRPDGAAGHDAEAHAAWLVDEAGGEAIVTAIADPRLSTAVDGEGRPRRAAFELWAHEDAEVPRRASGQALAVASLDLGDLRLDAAVFAWRMEGREGVGRYDLLRRA